MKAIIIVEKFEKREKRSSSKSNIVVCNVWQLAESDKWLATIKTYLLLTHLYSYINQRLHSKLYIMRPNHGLNLKVETTSDHQHHHHCAPVSLINNWLSFYLQCCLDSACERYKSYNSNKSNKWW